MRPTEAGHAKSTTPKRDKRTCEPNNSVQNVSSHIKYMKRTNDCECLLRIPWETYVIGYKWPLFSPQDFPLLLVIEQKRRSSRSDREFNFDLYMVNYELLLRYSSSRKRVSTFSETGFTPSSSPQSPSSPNKQLRSRIEQHGISQSTNTTLSNVANTNKTLIRNTACDNSFQVESLWKEIPDLAMSKDSRGYFVEALKCEEHAKERKMFLINGKPICGKWFVLEALNARSLSMVRMIQFSCKIEFATVLRSLGVTVISEINCPEYCDTSGVSLYDQISKTEIVFLD